MALPREKYADISKLPQVNLRTVTARKFISPHLQVVLSCKHSILVSASDERLYKLDSEVYCKVCGGRDGQRQR